MNNKDGIATTILIIILAAVFSYGIKALLVDSDCLELGYPRSHIDYKLTGYCAKRVNQTDIVVLIKELEN